MLTELAPRVDPGLRLGASQCWVFVVSGAFSRCDVEAPHRSGSSCEHRLWGSWLSVIAARGFRGCAYRAGGHGLGRCGRRA